MRPILSRFAAVLALATAAFVLPEHAYASSVPHRARGTAQFISDTEFVGTGNATHLGRYTETGNVVFAPTGDPNVLAVSGSATYTAANGDQLHALVAGDLNTSTGVIAVTVTYVGGTGRFIDATGSASLAGQMLGGGAVSVVVAGNIDF
jgi:hypothetical protein